MSRSIPQERLATTPAELSLEELTHVVGGTPSTSNQVWVGMTDDIVADSESIVAGNGGLAWPQ